MTDQSEQDGTFTGPYDDAFLEKIYPILGTGENLVELHITAGGRMEYAFNRIEKDEQEHIISASIVTRTFHRGEEAYEEKVEHLIIEGTRVSSNRYLLNGTKTSASYPVWKSFHEKEESSSK